MMWNKRLSGNGTVSAETHTPTRLSLPTISDTHYHNAQIDDYADLKRRDFRHRAGTRLELAARFSHGADQLIGTAGFGFWNAPYGRGAALPQAVWFFFASPPNDLPLNKDGAGRGWFASTIDAGSWRAKRLIPLAPLALVGNQFGRIRQTIMPPIMSQLGISFTPLPETMTEWQTYRLDWRTDGCQFYVNDTLHLATPHSPRGPLGFICWIDNQFAVLTPRGQLRAGTLPIVMPQSLEIDTINIQPLD